MFADLCGVNAPVSFRLPGDGMDSSVGKNVCAVCSQESKHAGSFKSLFMGLTGSIYALELLKS